MEDEDLFVAEYKEFLSCAKTERITVSLLKRRMERAGFKKYEEAVGLHAGDKIYFDCRGKALVVAVIGMQPLSLGLHIVASHVDSPHFDLKPNPCLPMKGFVYFDTHHYGYMKKYQWLARPLALCGVVFKKDGGRIDIMEGISPQDSQFVITDCAPHFGMDQESGKVGDLISAEDMDALAFVGEASDFESCLKRKYGIEKEDFNSAELELVPSDAPVFLGLNKKLIAGYGQDDRACVFSLSWALERLARSGCAPAQTALAVFSDKEEVGAVGSTGLDGSLIENVILDMAVTMPRCCSDSFLTVRKALQNSKAISADACVGSDPHFVGSDSMGNESRIGNGVVVHKYEGGLTKGGVSDSSAEFVAEIRSLFERKKIKWQMSENGRQEKGSSGTQANSLAKYGMDVIDVGIPLLNMHSPMEIAAVNDCYLACQAFHAFILQ